MLLITIGISGSGKSHLKNQLENYFDDFYNVEPDNLRRELFGDVNEQSDGYKVFDLAGSKIRQYTTKEGVTFFNATNTNWSKLEKFIKDYTSTDNVLYIIMMDSLDLELCKSRIKKDLDNNVDRSRVPEDVVERQYNNFLSCKENAEKSDELVYLYDGSFGRLVSFIEDKI